MKTLAALLFAAFMYAACWQVGEKYPHLIPVVILLGVGLVVWLG